MPIAPASLKAFAADRKLQMEAWLEPLMAA
jgi:hypothetical protein